MADNKIEPCPFCGEKCTKHSLTDTSRFWVRCSFCGYSGPYAKTLLELAAAHNRVSRNNAIADELGNALEGLLFDYERQTDRFAGSFIEDTLDKHTHTSRAAIAKWKGEN